MRLIRLNGFIRLMDSFDRTDVACFIREYTQRFLVSGGVGIPRLKTDGSVGGCRSRDLHPHHCTALHCTALDRSIDGRVCVCSSFGLSCLVLPCLALPCLACRRNNQPMNSPRIRESGGDRGFANLSFPEAFAQKGRSSI